MLIKDPRPPEFPPPVIYHQHLSLQIQVEMPSGVETYTSHLGLEHELDDSSSSGIDDVLFTTGSSSSTLVE
jgi:hypothetical protein